MEVYILNNLNNGDILLEKKIIDDTEYIIDYKDNGDKLLKKINAINIIDIQDIKNYNFANSIILECTINDQKCNKLNYNPIIRQIYREIGDGSIIIRKTKINIKTIKIENKGFTYLEDIGISVQSVDNNKGLLEIIHQSIENNISLSMKIKLDNNTIVYISS
jgi:hypothetical protein